MRTARQPQTAVEATRPGIALVAVFVLVYLALVVRLVLLIDRYAVNVFAWDQWDFLDGLFYPRSLWQLFKWQHGPHRMGLGLPLMVIVEQMTAWNAVAISYLNAAVTAAAGLLAVCLKNRVAPPLRWTDAALPVLFLNSSQWAIFVVTPDVSHGPLPLLLVVLFAMILTIETGPWQLVLLLFVDLVTAYTGFGIVLGWITPVWILLRWWRSELNGSAALFALAGAFAILASFLYDYQFPWQLARYSCLRTGTPSRSPLSHLMYFFLLFARAFGATRSVSFPTMLGVAVGGAVCWLLAIRSVQLLKRGSPHDHLLDVTWVLAAFTLVFAAFSSAGRGCQGAHAGLNSRYVPYMVPGTLALYLSYVGALWQKPGLLKRWLAYACLGAYVALDLWPHSVDLRAMQYFKVGKERWVDCFRSERNTRLCRTADFGIYRDPGSPVLGEKLAIMERRRLGFFARR